MEAIEILRTQCMAFTYFFLFLQLSDFAPAWAIHCSVNTLLESVSEEELQLNRKKRKAEKRNYEQGRNRELSSINS